MDFLKENLTHITENFEKQILIKEFNSNYGFRSKPVVFKRAFKEWDVKHKWSLEYLNNVLKQCSSSTDSKEDIIAYFNDTSNIDKYLKYQITPDSVLYRDYIGDVPDFFSCWYKNNDLGKRPSKFFSWLYIGKKNTKTNLHTDIWDTSAWNYLIKGKKVWLFYPDILKEKLDNDFKKGKVRNVFYDSFPEQNTIKPLLCVQSEGDLVYTPSGMYHSVINLSPSISLTENFINETNYNNVLSYFKKNCSNLDNINAMQKIISKGFENLKQC